MHSRISLLFVLVVNVVLCAQFRSRKEQHSVKSLTNNDIKHIAKLTNVLHLNSVIDNILIPRVVDTPTHTQVYNFIKDELEDNGFTVEIDKFTETVPILGSLNFKNIIGVLNPQAERYLVLACHYDSKYFPNDYFVGATDSAVPCAMMLNLIKILKQELATIENDDVSLMLLFLDGEEAFKQWTSTDSIYGARNLARTMNTNLKTVRGGENVSMLERMDMFVLLDLLGAANPTFYSYFRDTDKHYLNLCHAERQLAKLGLLTNHQRNYFRQNARNSFVEDDHIPFLKKGVPILHLIPTPFPDVWHTPKDDRSIIDIDTVVNLNKILSVFIVEYLNIPLNNVDAEPDTNEMDTRPQFHEEF